MQLYYTDLLKVRFEWTRNRHGNFWEKDVPLMSEEIFIENFRMNTTYRKSIPLEKRVAIAVYTLRSSAEYASVGHIFGVSKATEYLSSDIINETKIMDCVDGFGKLGFPQCFGAIDGCHFEVKPNASDVTDYHNYKGWNSTILLAVVDHRYRFIYINVGVPGRCNDSAIFENSTLRKKLENPIFQEKAIMYNGINIPVLLIGDSAFRLSKSMMKPYPFQVNAPIEERNFNYTLSKSRRVVENAFGHLKARFRRLGKGIDNNIENVNCIIKCCCVLHNFLNEQNEDINSLWLQKDVTDNEIGRPQSDNMVNIYDFNPKAEEIRNAIADYLMK
ncbi:putative nuclease HARBI1 [Lucilia cuprina]|nr:putative nuclease HARBI1 [Lucilia cuprina]